jgi:hypothetical protein
VHLDRFLDLPQVPQANANVVVRAALTGDITCGRNELKLEFFEILRSDWSIFTGLLRDLQVLLVVHTGVNGLITTQYFEKCSFSLFVQQVTRAARAWRTATSATLFIFT